MRHNIMRVIVVSMFLLASAGVPFPAEAHTPTGPLGDLWSTLAACAADGPLWVDTNITASGLGVTKKHWADPYNDGDGDTECMDFSYFKRPLYNKPNNNVYVGFGGPQISDPGNCDHSAVFYVVLKKVNGGNWTVVAAGTVHGRYVNNYCDHSYLGAGEAASVAHLHEGGSSPWVSVYGGNQSGSQEVGEIRVAAFSWAHNDPALGHSGDLCEDSNCYFDTYVIAW